MITPRLKDVAEAAGVSIQTVAAVVNRTRTTTAVSEQTRQRVLALAEEMGYKRHAAATSLVSGRVQTIGFACTNLHDPHLLSAVAQAEEICSKNSHRLIVASIHDAPDWAAMLRERQIDYLLAIARNVFEFTGQKIPEVLHPRVAMISNAPIPAELRQWSAEYFWDDRTGSAMAGRYLCNRGCREVGVLAGINAPSARVKGLLDVMRRRGVTTHLIELQDESDRVIAGWTMTRQLLSEHPAIDGLYMRNDRFYPGVLEALRHHDDGRARTDLTIIGYGATCSSVANIKTPMEVCVRRALANYFEGKTALPISENFKPELLLPRAAPLIGPYG